MSIFFEHCFQINVLRVPVVDSLSSKLSVLSKRDPTAKGCIF